MDYLLDSNILLYAKMDAMPEHKIVSKWLEATVSDRNNTLHICETSVLSFLRIATNEKVFQPVLPTPDAQNFIESLLNCPNVNLLFASANHFTEVTKEAGLHTGLISFGLGVSVGDINGDNYPDIYVGNDFHENDYLYINQKDGSFKDESTIRMSHTSQYSMGVDAADLNNDGFPEIVSLDMLPNDPLVLKRSQGEDSYDIFNLKIRYGYHYQYTRNNLQFNSYEAFKRIF